MTLCCWTQLLLQASPPVILSASCFDGRTVGIQFDQALDPAGATDVSRYSVTDAYSDLNGTYPISSVLKANDPTRIILRLGREIFETAVNISGSNVLGANSLVGTSQLVARVSNVRGIHIGATNEDVIASGAIGSFGLYSLDFQVDGPGVGGTTDDFLFVPEVWSGDFVYQGEVSIPDFADSTNAAVGLMYRETLSSDSPFYAVFISRIESNSGSALRMQAFWRESRGATAVQIAPTPDFPDTLIATNLQFRLVRSGQKISTYWDTNHAGLSRQGALVTFTAAIPDPIFVGGAGVSVAHSVDSSHAHMFAAAARGEPPLPPTPNININQSAVSLNWKETTDYHFHLLTTDPSINIQAWSLIPIWPGLQYDGSNLGASVSVPESGSTRLYKLRLSRF